MKKRAGLVEKIAELPFIREKIVAARTKAANKLRVGIAKAKTFEEYARLRFHKQYFREKFDPRSNSKLLARNSVYGTAEGRDPKKRIKAMTLSYYYSENPEVMINNHGLVGNVLKQIEKENTGAIYAASIGAGELSHEVWFKKEHPRLAIHAVDPYNEIRRRGMRTMELVNQKVDYFGEGNFSNPDLPRAKYDLVYSFDAFHWVEGTAAQKEALDKMCSLVQKGGHLVISYIPNYSGVENPMPPKVIESYVASKGFAFGSLQDIGHARTGLHFVKK
ncbi:MAG: class I SAM-dependent methyltransferase [Candidatus Diapherotrites archaeon]